MDYSSRTDVKSTTKTNSLWQIDEHVGSVCEKENDIDDIDDFVLKFSTDESDCEDAAHSNDNYINSPITACNDLVKNCSDSSSMQKNQRLSTYALRYDDKITKTTRSVRRRTAKSKVIKNQRSVLNYFCRRDIPDEEVADEIRKDPKADVIVETQKLIRQLLNARIILERLPASLLVKNDEHDNGDYQETTCKIKRYCTSCDRTFVRISNCRDCNSVLKYECAKCGTRYSTRNRLNYHRRTKCLSRPVYRCSQWNGGLKRQPINCWQCSEKFSYYWELIQHKEVCKLTDAELAAVRKSYKGLLSREENLIASVGEDAFKNTVKRFCPNCKKYLETWTRPLKICPECNGSIMFSCGSCGQFVNVLRKLINHLKTKKMCIKGDEEFKYKDSTLASKQLLSCAHCPFRVEGKRKLIKHLFDHHGDDNGRMCRNLHEESATKENGRKRKLSSSEILDGTTYKKARFDAASSERFEVIIRIFCPKCAKTKDAKIQDSIKRKCWDRSCKSALHYECTACKKQYLSHYGILQHIDSNCPSICQTQRNLLQCNKCTYVSYSMIKFNLHYRYYHPPDDQKVEFVCDICNKKFITAYKLKRHRFYCKSEPIHKCEQCDFRTKYFTNFQRHFKHKHYIKKCDESII